MARRPSVCSHCEYGLQFGIALIKGTQYLSLSVFSVFAFRAGFLRQ